MIFFNQHDLEDNKDLIEITDLAQKKLIKKDFQQSCGAIASATSPQICGTIVNTCPDLRRASDGLSAFGRKLLMMRADLFTLLSVSIKEDFITNHEHGTAIDAGVQTLLEMEFHDNRYESLVAEKIEEIESKLRGWQIIMHERCVKSELNESKKINYLDCLGNKGLSAD